MVSNSCIFNLLNFIIKDDISLGENFHQLKQTGHALFSNEVFWVSVESTVDVAYPLPKLSGDQFH